MPLSLTTPAHRHLLRPVFAGALVLCCATAARAQDTAHAQLDAAKPFAAMSNSVHSMRDSLVAIARAQVGTRYIRGGNSPQSGFDCSGLVRYVMAALKVDLPRTARQQAATGFAVKRDASQLRPGDLLTFGKGRKGSVSHIGIYVGGGRYVHASSVAGQVIESNLDRPASPLIKAWRGVRRVVAGASADSSSKGDT